MPRGKKRKSGRGRPTALSRLSTTELLAEVERRRGRLGHLQSRRSELENELHALTAQISEVESIGPAQSATVQAKLTGGGGRRGRAKSANSLQAVLQSVLKGRTMSIQEMADATKNAGYKSMSKSFRSVVSLALLKNRKMFKRVGRGLYTAK